MAKCAAITQAGGSCQGIPTAGSQWCYVHDPDKAEERRRQGSRGGRRGGRGRPLTELADTKAKLLDVAERTEAGEMDTRIVAALVQVYNCYMRAVELGLKAREQEELEQRLEEIEDALKTSGRRYG